MPLELDKLSKKLIREHSTMFLRQLLHSKTTPKAYRKYVYAVLLERREKSRSKRHGN